MYVLLECPWGDMYPFERTSGAVLTPKDYYLYGPSHGCVSFQGTTVVVGEFQTSRLANPLPPSLSPPRPPLWR